MGHMKRNFNTPSIKDCSEYGGTIEKSRIMTTMSPSAKDRLQLNVKMTSPKTMKAQVIPRSVIKMIDPAHKKIILKKNLAGARKASAGSSVYKLRAPAEDNFLENKKDINDETFLFRVNAATPLVHLQRETVGKSVP